MKKRIMLATDFPIGLFAATLANMLSHGLEGIEIFPGIISEPSEENLLIVSYHNQVPGNVIEFLRKQKKEAVVFFMTHEAAVSLGNEMLEEIPCFWINDREHSAATTFKETIGYIETISLIQLAQETGK